jgi:hypothetical protein
MQRSLRIGKVIQIFQCDRENIGVAKLWDDLSPPTETKPIMIFDIQSALA